MVAGCGEEREAYGERVYSDYSGPGEREGREMSGYVYFATNSDRSLEADAEFVDRVRSGVVRGGEEEGWP